MSWAKSHIARLMTGETVTFRPKGNSMQPLIESGQLVTVDPLKDATDIAVGDIVLCSVHGSYYLHLVKAIQADRFQIGNNRGHINGWIGRQQIFGRYRR